MRPVLIAAAVTLAALVASMAVGLQQPPEVPAEIGTALHCELVDGRVVCWESP